MHNNNKPIKLTCNNSDAEVPGGTGSSKSRDSEPCLGKFVFIVIRCTPDYTMINIFKSA